MITRIEIDGFKSFMDFELDLEPFTVLAGSNNSGKSNLFEAILLLRDLYPSGDGAALVKKGRGTGVELFHRADDGTAHTSFTVNAYIAEPEFSPTSVDVTVHSQPGQRGLAVSVMRASADTYVDDYGWYEALASLDTVIAINPHPPVMRDGTRLNDEESLAPDGANLAAVIGRISEAGALEDFVIDTAYVIGDLTGIEPIRDERRNSWDFDLIMKGGRRFTPSLVSDGTLRVLALLAALHDPAYRGTVVIENERGKIDALRTRLADTLPRQSRLVAVVPIRETEAWLLADPDALPRGGSRDVSPASPREVESIADPKKPLAVALGHPLDVASAEYIGENVSPECPPTKAFRKT